MRVLYGFYEKTEGRRHPRSSFTSVVCLPITHVSSIFYHDLWRDLTRSTLDIEEEIQTIEHRLEEEAAIASGYGTGPWSFARGALHELSRPGMRNRVYLVTCAFTLTQLSGAAGM